MKCSDCQPLLSAYIDNEVSSAQLEAVDAHLGECSICRNVRDELLFVDEKLSTLCVPENLATTILDSTVDHATRTNQPALPRSRSRYLWGIFVAIAASIAFLIFLRPSEPVGEPEAPPPLVAKLIRATGKVEVLESGGQIWSVLDPSSVIRQGTRVRTGDHVTCEIETSQHSLIRTNEKTELVFQQHDRIQINMGQLWCRPTDDVPIQVDISPHSGDESEPGNPVVCKASSEFQLMVSQEQAVFTSLAKQDAQLRISESSISLGPGKTVSVAKNGDLIQRDDLAARSKVWQLPLLAISSEHEALGELSSILQPLLVRVGRTKARHMDELQIRALGPPGAIPLLTYALSDESRSEPNLRYTAVTLAAPLSDRNAVGLLNKLSLDEDPGVARVCRATLERLGENP